ncbi:MAG: BrnA antitoxin family protein [Acetobacteraceae bacterium]|nr:BrnA antitoxin family protein [Acetobacteraceae bacterium]
MPAIDLSPERLEAQDALRWNGRLLSELSDTELAAAAEGLAAMDPPPDQPGIRSQRNWLKLRVTWPQKRVALRLRVDEVVFEWFSREGIGYQGRVNAVLRAYVEAQLEAESRGR